MRNCKWVSSGQPACPAGWRDLSANGTCRTHVHEITRSVFFPASALGSVFVLACFPRVSRDHRKLEGVVTGIFIKKLCCHTRCSGGREPGPRVRGPQTQPRARRCGDPEGPPPPVGGRQGSPPRPTGRVAGCAPRGRHLPPSPGRVLRGAAAHPVSSRAAA